MRYAVCGLYPGCMWWEGLGASRHIKHVSAPVKRFKTPTGAQNYAVKNSRHFSQGLVVVDTQTKRVWDGCWLAIDSCGNWGDDI